MRRHRTFEYTVSITLIDPQSLTSNDVREYVRDALGSWGGQYRPDDPLFPTNISRVAVSYTRVQNRGNTNEKR